MNNVIIDSNFLVGFLDEKDKWHQKASNIYTLLTGQNYSIIYFDCVISETLSVIARRLEEKHRSKEFSNLSSKLCILIPENNITWIFPHIKQYFSRIINLMNEHEGILNFNDALIAVTALQLKIQYIATFDNDFDRIDWLKRLY